MKRHDGCLVDMTVAPLATESLCSVHLQKLTVGCHLRTCSRPRGSAPRARSKYFHGMPDMNTRPDLQVTVATAQAIVDCALAGRTAATVSTIHGGDIAAV